MPDSLLQALRERLFQSSDMDLRRYLDDFWRPGASLPSNLVLLERVDSTNLMARGIASDYLAAGRPPPATLVVALQQSHGLGRRGRRWSSPRARGVYASWILPVAGCQLPSLPLLVGVGLADGLSAFSRERCRLKWPNDLMVGGRKIGGILIESLATGEQGAVAIVGFGVNHSHTREQLPVKAATTLELEAADVLPTLAELTRRLVDAIAAELRHLGDMETAVERYRRCTAHDQGDPIRCRTAEGVVEGTFAGFDGRGFLLLRTDSGERLVVAGDLG